MEELKQYYANKISKCDEAINKIKSARMRIALAKEKIKTLKWQSK